MNASARTGSVLCRVRALLVVVLGIGPLVPGAYAQTPGGAVARDMSAAGRQTTIAVEAPPAMPDAARAVTGDSSGIEPGAIQKSLDALRFDFAQPASVSPLMTTQANARAEAQRRYRRGRGDRGVAGLVLGAIGGLAAGGAIGVAVAEHSCTTCSDPALHGFLIGAPIGAFVGGMIGYALAR